MATQEREQVADHSQQEEAATQGAIHINTADGDSEPLKLPSLCMRCHETVGQIIRCLVYRPCSVIAGMLGLLLVMFAMAAARCLRMHSWTYAPCGLQFPVQNKFAHLWRS